jgi:XTP/dITP diphosphohydrolase
MSEQSLVIATRNRGKLLELRALIRELPLVLLDLSSFPSVQTIPETGATFVENASLKAAGYAIQIGEMTLADDSGLEVDALGGAPGVRSARYAGDGASDSERVDKLLSELSHVRPRERTARFVSAIAIAGREGVILNISSGVCEGRIAEAPRGANGFGYDPVFIPEGYDQTFAELRPQLKNRISHRGKALEAATHFLKCLTVSSRAG